MLLRLDLDTGRVTWISAGHPPPLVIRQGRHGRTLDATPTTPLGVHLGGEPKVATASLQPGDLLLLYTDGLTEARGADGQMFELHGLTQFIVREASSGAPAPETLRRLRHAVVAAPGTDLRDDATAILVEWRRGGEQAILPETVA